MGRYAGKKEPNVKPVKKIELSEKHFHIRLIAVVLLIALAAGAFVYGIYSYFHVDEGWTKITAESSSDINCSDDFVFLYNLGAGENSAATDLSEITEIYTEATVNAYRLFNVNEEFDNVKNIYYINNHPNEIIQVDSVLYNAFSMLNKYENRYIFLAPLFEQYENMYYCTDDVQTKGYDPNQNEDIRKYFNEVLAFANSNDDINIELIGDNRIRLNVSEAYLTYAEKNEVYRFVDFYWMKNAFITDYIADSLKENGLTFGSVSSYDGFVRNLDDSGESYTFNIYDRVDNMVYGAAALQYTNNNSIVYLRDFPMSSRDDSHYYEFSDGELRNPYISMSDGLCRASIENLTAYSESEGCGEILLGMVSLYVADEFDESALLEMAGKDINFIYCIDSNVCYTDENAKITGLFESEDGQVKYTAKYKSK